MYDHLNECELRLKIARHSNWASYYSCNPDKPGFGWCLSQENNEIRRLQKELAERGKKK